MIHLFKELNTWWHFLYLREPTNSCMPLRCAPHFSAGKIWLGLPAQVEGLWNNGSTYSPSPLGEYSYPGEQYLWTEHRSKVKEFFVLFHPALHILSQFTEEKAMSLFPFFRKWKWGNTTSMGCSPSWPCWNLSVEDIQWRKTLVKAMTTFTKLPSISMLWNPLCRI